MVLEEAWWSLRWAIHKEGGKAWWWECDGLGLPNSWWVRFTTLRETWRWCYPLRYLITSSSTPFTAWKSTKRTYISNKTTIWSILQIWQQIGSGKRRLINSSDHPIAQICALWRIYGTIWTGRLGCNHHFGESPSDVGCLSGGMR